MTFLLASLGLIGGTALAGITALNALNTWRTTRYRITQATISALTLTLMATALTVLWHQHKNPECTATETRYEYNPKTKTTRPYQHCTQRKTR